MSVNSIHDNFVQASSLYLTSLGWTLIPPLNNNFMRPDSPDLLGYYNHDVQLDTLLPPPHLMVIAPQNNPLSFASIQSRALSLNTSPFESPCCIYCKAPRELEWTKDSPMCKWCIKLSTESIMGSKGHINLSKKWRQMEEEGQARLVKAKKVNGEEIWVKQQKDEKTKTFCQLRFQSIPQ